MLSIPGKGIEDQPEGNVIFKYIPGKSLHRYRPSNLLTDPQTCADRPTSCISASNGIPPSKVEVKSRLDLSTYHTSTITTLHYDVTENGRWSMLSSPTTDPVEFRKILNESLLPHSSENVGRYWKSNLSAYSACSRGTWKSLCRETLLSEVSYMCQSTPWKRYRKNSCCVKFTTEEAFPRENRVSRRPFVFCNIKIKQKILLLWKLN